MKKQDYQEQCNNLLRFFEFSHLARPQLKEISIQFYNLAHHVQNGVMANYQKVECLKKLLEAKDCAVRAEL